MLTVVLNIYIYIYIHIYIQKYNGNIVFYIVVLCYLLVCVIFDLHDSMLTYVKYRHTNVKYMLKYVKYMHTHVLFLLKKKI